MDTSTASLSRLQFLWTASKTYLSTYPQLSHFLLRQFGDVAFQEQIDVHKQVAMQYCAYCSAPFVPGENCTVRITSDTHASNSKMRHFPREEQGGQERDMPAASLNASILLESSKKIQKRKRLKNAVAYHCLLCGHSTLFPAQTRDTTITIKSKEKLQTSSQTTFPSSSSATTTTSSSVPFSPVTTPTSSSAASQPTLVSITKEKKPKKRKTAGLNLDFSPSASAPTPSFTPAASLNPFAVSSVSSTHSSAHSTPKLQNIVREAPVNKEEEIARKKKKKKQETLREMIKQQELQKKEKGSLSHLFSLPSL